MKNNTFSACASALILAAGLFAVTFQAAGQSVLIKVYLTDPSNVRFVSTVSNAANNASVSISSGIDLIKFFTNSTASTPAAASGAVTGYLVPSGTTTPFNAWENDTLLALGRRVDLNLFNNSSSQTEVFSTSVRSISNTVAYIDLSSMIAYFPKVGVTGDIYSGDVNSTGQNWLIGKWMVVVPEPSVEAQLAMGAMLLAGLAFIRRSRRVSAGR
jgi:hypothetical protein